MLSVAPPATGSIVFLRVRALDRVDLRRHRAVRVVVGCVQGMRVALSGMPKRATALVGLVRLGRGWVARWLPALVGWVAEGVFFGERFEFAADAARFDADGHVT